MTYLDVYGMVKQASMQKEALMGAGRFAKGLSNASKFLKGFFNRGTGFVDDAAKQAQRLAAAHSAKFTRAAAAGNALNTGDAVQAGKLAWKAGNAAGSEYNALSKLKGLKAILQRAKHTTTEGGLDSYETFLRRMSPHNPIDVNLDQYYKFRPMFKDPVLTPFTDNITKGTKNLFQWWK